MIAEFAAFKELASAGKLDGKVYDAVRRNAQGGLAREGYVVIFGGAPDQETDLRFTAEQRVDSAWEYAYTCRVVDTTADGVRKFASALLANVIGQKLTLDGRHTNGIAMTASDDIHDDDSVNPPCRTTEG